MLIVPLVLVGCGGNTATADDFELKVTIEQKSFSPGNHISLTATLKNLSEYRLRIAYITLLYIEIPGVIKSPTVDGGGPIVKVIGAGEVIQRGWTLRIPYEISPGMYELITYVRFTLNPGRSFAKNIELSNIDKITVI